MADHYEIITVAGGYVIRCGQSHMGRDRYWERDARLASPFFSFEAADEQCTAMERAEEERRRRRPR